MTTPYASWTPSSDTHELATVYRGPFFERETVELWLPEFARSEPTRHLTLHARARRAGRRFANSAYMRDVRRCIPRALEFMGCFGVAFALVVLYRGAYIAAVLAGVAQ